MQPANPINSTSLLPKPVSKTGSQSSATAPQVVEESKANFKFEVGQQTQATIQEQVNPGLYKVQVAGQSMQMQLPGLIKIGSTITLQVVSVSPKLTFSVPGSGAPISTAEEISSTSRLLSDLAQMPLSKTMVEAPTGRAVWPSEKTAPESGKLAAALKDALANSGLFYESHQAQWVAGARSTAQLLIEPQNQLSQVTESAQPPQTGSLPVQPKPRGAIETIKPDALAVPVFEAKSTSTLGVATANTQNMGTVTDATSSAQSNELPIAKELIPLVQQQLHTLETHQLTWAGQIWPNQQMQWEIQGEPEHRSSRPDARQWKTEMQLALPRLGDVHASLVFNQGAIRLTLHAADAGAASLFERRLPELAAAMKNAGIPLFGAIVEKS